MRVAITFVLPLICISVFSQVNKLPADSLAKYSYPITGVYPIFGGGTGFFIKRNNHLYLVTAKHVINGCDGTGKKNELYADILLIGNKEDQRHSFTIDNRVLRKVLPCGGLDMYVKRIDSTFIPYYNSVEKFIIPEIEYFRTVEIFGYPMNTYDTGYIRIPNRKIHLSIPEQTFDFAYVYDSTWKVDNNLRKITYPKSVEVIGGFSGSPVFLQDKKTNEWRVIGIVSATLPVVGDSRASMLFVDIKYVIALINKLEKER